jgi:hypothetical protein
MHCRRKNLTYISVVGREAETINLANGDWRRRRSCAGRPDIRQKEEGI